MNDRSFKKDYDDGHFNVSMSIRETSDYEKKRFGTPDFFMMFNKQDGDSCVQCSVDQLRDFVKMMREKGIEI